MMGEGQLHKKIRKSFDKEFGFELEGDCSSGIPYILKVVEEAKKEIGTLNWLEELKDYILKHSIKITEETPIFSARHFASKIEKHKEKLERWFGETVK